MRRIATAAAAILVAAALAPSAAWAGEVTTHVVSRTTGVEIVSSVLSQVRGVEFGSSSATVTVEVEGGTREIGVTTDQLGSGGPVTQKSSADITSLLAVPVLLGAAIRFLRFVGRLGSM